MLRFENTAFAIGIACDDANNPVAIVLSTDSIEQGTTYLMSTTKGDLEGNDLSLTGDAVIILQGLQTNIRECIAANIPLVILDPLTGAEVAITVTTKVQP